jgi:hypothetical protein
MANSSTSEVYQILTSTGHSDLVEQLKSKDGWRALNEAKLAYFEILSSKLRLDEDKVLALVDMTFLPMMTEMGIVPRTVVEARDILLRMEKEADCIRDQKLIRRIVNITNDTSSDLDVVDGMSAIIKIAEADKPYSRIVSECGNFIIESMSFMEEPVDVELADTVQKLNV